MVFHEWFLVIFKIYCKCNNNGEIEVELFLKYYFIITNVNVTTKWYCWKKYPFDYYINIFPSTKVYATMNLMLLKDHRITNRKIKPSKSSEWNIKTLWSTKESLLKIL